jgi:hypothetical protein
MRKVIEADLLTLSAACSTDSSISPPHLSSLRIHMAYSSGVLPSRTLKEKDYESLIVGFEYMNRDDGEEN